MKVRELAHELRVTCSATTPNARNINFDWNEPSKVVRVEVDQDRARALGISFASVEPDHQRGAVGHDRHASCATTSI